nr:MAG TPA: hypothetical protein [Caudoviricetes sp.]
MEDREKFNVKKYNSPIYGVQKEEFEFFEKLYKFERKAFWKGFFVSAFIIIIISFLIAIIM